MSQALRTPQDFRKAYPYPHPALEDAERLEAKITARFHKICAGLEHPDLKRAAAAATNLSCFLYSCSPTTDLYDFHPYYVLDPDIVEYRKNPKRTTSTFYIDRHMYSNDYCKEPESRFLTRSEWLLQLIATPRAVDDRSVDFEEPLLYLVIRALEDALRHAEGRGQLGLFAEGRGTQLRVRRKRKRDDEEEHANVCLLPVAPSGAILPAVRAAAFLFTTMTDSWEHCDAVCRSDKDDEWFELDHDEILAVAIRLLRAPDAPAFRDDEVWACAACCLFANLYFDLESLHGNRRRNCREMLRKALGWPRSPYTRFAEHEAPIGSTHVAGAWQAPMEARARAEFDSYVLTPADRRLLDRLFHVANGWPRLGLNHKEARTSSLALLKLMLEFAPSSVANHICRPMVADRRLLEDVNHIGADEVDWRIGPNPDVPEGVFVVPEFAHEDEIPHDDDEDDEDEEGEEGEEEGDGDVAALAAEEEEDHVQQRGLAWHRHAPILVRATTENPGQECAICFESLDSARLRHRRGEPYRLHCRCTTDAAPYHELCLRQHLVERNTCPRCRAEPATVANAHQIRRAAQVAL